jgi:probable rRNA maturation factor
VKIAFHNRQRRRPVDSKALSLDFERLLSFLAQDLSQAPPAWLKKSQLKQIFSRGQLSVVLVSNKAIRKVNRQWRDQDKPTDVLSFPLELTPPPFLRTRTSPGAKATSQADLDFDPVGECDQWLVGEVIISLDRASEQAQDYGHSLERELSFLFVHGVLHVLGFDHVTKEEEKEMFGRQRRILAAAGVKRH